MSSPLAIAAVTAALKDLLNDGLLNQDLSAMGSFTVTASPPDRVTTGPTEPNQLNLFLYRVSANQGWRNEALPGRDGSGQKLSNPPLALDLHYLLSAYGASDFNAEILLGYAMHLIHKTPVLTRAQLRTVLGGVSPVTGQILPSPFGSTLVAADLADQIELVKITPVYLGTEELSKMWTAMQARYRPTMAYMASVVLIQDTTGARAAPPVLQRGANDRGPFAGAAPFPTVSSVRAAASELLPALRLGDGLLLGGSNFDTSGTLSLLLDNARGGSTQLLIPSAAPTASSVAATIPSLAADPGGMSSWAIGVYNVSVIATRPDAPDYQSNGVPVALSPSVTVAPNAAMAGTVSLTLTAAPRLKPGQEAGARLLFGSRSIVASSISTPADPTLPTSLQFEVPDVLAGTYLVRLRVDGVDSVPVLVQNGALTFDPAQQVTVT